MYGIINMDKKDYKNSKQEYKENKKAVKETYKKFGGKFKSGGDAFIDFMKSTVDPSKKDIILNAINRGKLAQFTRMNRFKNV